MAGRFRIYTVTDGFPERSKAKYHLRVHGLVDHELFESITDPRKRLFLTSWQTAEAARSWKPTRPAAMQSLRHRRVRIIRDYGMFERREAPQFYPAVERAVPAIS